jgi:hypothetical protein
MQPIRGVEANQGRPPGCHPGAAAAAVRGGLAVDPSHACRHCGGTGTEEIAGLFSIRRPLRSSKLIRLPQRGQLGNGLRVVAGAVLCSEGSLVVITRNPRIVLRPQWDGLTTMVSVTPAERPVGSAGSR